MFSDKWSPTLALIALLFAVVQWIISLRTAKRKRDSELTGWGGEVIRLMAELETLYYPIVKDSHLDRAAAERLSYHASALVDKGRLFFPNVKSGWRPRGDGTRTKILDEVLRACYAARHLAAHGRGSNDRQHREQVWAMRKSFVELLQRRLGPTLLKVGKDDVGQHVDLDPALWPRRQLVLPGDGGKSPVIDVPAQEIAR